MGAWAERRLRWVLNTKKSFAPAREKCDALTAELLPHGLPVLVLADVLGIPRLAFYRRSNGADSAVVVERRAPLITDAQVVAAIRELMELNPSYAEYGYRRLRAPLARHRGWRINHEGLCRILTASGLGQARVERRRGQPTADRPTTEPPRPNQLWQMDMTKFIVEGLAGCISWPASTCSTV